MFLFPMPIAPHSLPPNPSLVAIILIITTRRGPRFVFHYPGTPEPSQPSNSWAFGSIGSDSEDSDDGGSSDDATGTSDTGDEERSGGGVSRANSVGSRDGGGGGGGGGGVGGGGGKSVGSRTRASASVATSNSRRTTRTLREDGPEDEEDVDDDIEALDLSSATENGTGGGKNEGGGVEGDGRGGGGNKNALAEWEKLLGYPTEGLEKLLSPPDKFRRRKFEVSVDELVFLGYPVFAKEDGTWKKRKNKGKEKRKGKGERTDEDEGSIVTEKNPFDGHSRERKTVADLDMFAVRDAAVDAPELSPTTTRNDIRRPNESSDAADHTDAALSSYASTGGMSEAASEDKSISSTSGSHGGDDMSMFHLVFVMNPPTLEYHIRVQEMYDNVVKKFSKALKYEQVNSGWVEKEATKILTMKNQAKESKTRMPMSVLWARILQQSPLAKAIANVYTSIASNKIAHVSIGASFAASIQIPQAVSTSYVATPMEPQLPGLWLTTASMLEDDDGVPTLSPHAAILLLEDKETILKEIESDDNKGTSTTTNDPLAYFIRALSPTKSLQKLSASLSLSLSDMQFLARHLIYWRRARAVPPLHIRDTYIVSPNCDLKQLAHATTQYAQAFPSLPSLPSMLQLLSTKPRQYGYLIPSKDHKAAYMDILAWLLRGGWVTQLRTFAWVKVTPAIKAAAAVQVRKEAEDRAAAKAAKLSAVATRPDINGSSHTQRQQQQLPHRPARRTYSEDDYMSMTSTSRKSSKASPRLDALLSPTIRVPPSHNDHQQHNNPARSRNNSTNGSTSSDTESVSSVRTTIGPVPPPPHLSLSSPALAPLKPSPLHAVDNINPLSPPPHPQGTTPQGFPPIIETDPDTTPPSPSIVSTTHDTLTIPEDITTSLTTTTTTTTTSSTNNLPLNPTLSLPSTDPSTYTTTLLPSPHKASSLESKYLALIAAGLADKELKDMWAVLVKYFDGRRAVESIAGREGLKRRRVDALMGALEREGVLVVVRHW